MKETVYANERNTLCERAFLSENSAGRLKPLRPCPVRTDFMRDRDRIIHSKSFRRLMHKMQVFLAPEGDHYRTRLTHTLEVTQIARTLARALRLNEDLTEAAALGHDLGHTPFGHSGERALDRLCPNGFRHYEQSLRVADKLENLNLTVEVRDGMLNHSGASRASTLEGQLIKYADRIAYINHDIDDAIRAGVLKEGDLPKEYISVVGETPTKRINNTILAIYEKSSGKPFVEMDEKMATAMAELRKFMFQNVYTEKSGNSENERADRLLEILFNRFAAHPEEMPEFFVGLMDKYDKVTVICDYLASMSDTYAINLFNDLFVPKRWVVL